MAQAAQEGGGGSRWRGAVALAALVAGGVLVLFVGAGRHPPDLKPTLEHRAALGSPMPQSCLVCHRRSGGLVPQPPGHTGREDCTSCHALAPS